MSSSDVHCCQNLSYIDLFRRNIKVKLSTNIQYRGNVFRENVKHCFEYTFSDLKSLTQEIGFSNAITRKKFVSFFPFKENNQILCKTGFLSVEDIYYPCSMSLEENVPYEVCFNSENQFFQVFKRNEYCSAYINLEPESTPYWFLYIDQGSGDGDIINLNAGYIPSGYLPWIFPLPTVATCIQNYFKLIHTWELLVPIFLS